MTKTPGYLGPFRISGLPLLVPMIVVFCSVNFVAEGQVYVLAAILIYCIGFLDSKDRKLSDENSIEILAIKFKSQAAVTAKPLLWFAVLFMISGMFVKGDVGVSLSGAGLVLALFSYRFFEHLRSLTRHQEDATEPTNPEDLELHSDMRETIK